MAILVLVFMVLGVVSSARAAGNVDLTISQNEINAVIDVDGLYAANLRITFENVIGLSEDSISISAVPVDVKNLALLTRFGDASLYSVPALFPVLIQISPTPQSSLSFTGVVEIELSTSNLAFDPKFRLFKSPNGGNFEDITNFSGIGSYRVRGTSGDFSDFIIALDARTNAQAIESKFTKLQYAFSTHATRIPADTAQALQSYLDAARAAYQSGSRQQAIEHLQSFVNQIVGATNIPNSYRANDLNTVNVSGDLRRHAGTLIFSLRL